MRLLRAFVRLLRLGAVLGWSALQIVLLRRDARLVIHRTAKALLGVFDARVSLRGVAPESGLILSNHLSYLDIVVLEAMAPTVFVSKSDVRSWPVFGWFAKRMGTVFAERERRSSTGRSVSEIRAALDQGQRVVLFPEGTSTAGDRLAPFRSSLLEPAVGRSVTAAAIAYRLEPGDGDPALFVCYWRDMTLVPHLWSLLGRRRVHVDIAFEPHDGQSTDRKTLALELHQQVERMRLELRGEKRRDPVQGCEEARCAHAA